MTPAIIVAIINGLVALLPQIFGHISVLTAIDGTLAANPTDTANAEIRALLRPLIAARLAQAQAEAGFSPSPF